jgi:hypothetical protein
MSAVQLFGLGLIFAGIGLGGLAIPALYGHWLRHKMPGGQKVEDVPEGGLHDEIARTSSALERRIDEVLRLRGDRHFKWMLSSAWIVLLCGAFLYWIGSTPTLQSGARPGGETGAGASPTQPGERGGEGGPIATATSPGVPDGGLSRTKPTDWGLGWLVVVNILLLGIGSGLVLFGKSGTAKTAGVASLLGGIVAHGYLVKEFKLDKLINIEHLITLDKPKLQIAVAEELRSLGGIGPQYLGGFPNFKIGQATLDLEGFDADGEVDRICSAWREHRNKGRDGILLIVGATDRLVLRGEYSQRFETNVGLARARAETVRSRLLACGTGLPSKYSVTPERVLVLVSGPRNTPERTFDRREAKPIGFPEDRRVDVWAFWSFPATSSP